MSELLREERRYIDHEAPHNLYRVYDVDDRLLYIGCARDVGSRMATHASSWHNPVSAYLNFRGTRWETEEPAYPGRIAARAAEKAAIGAEAPLLNRHHNKGRGLVGEALEAELQRTRGRLEDTIAVPFRSVLGVSS